MKKELYKSRFLICCLVISVIGFFMTKNIVTSLFFLLFINYSGNEISKRLYDTKVVKSGNELPDTPPKKRG